MTSIDVRAAALAAYEAGLSVVPPTEDGEKKPEAEWWTRDGLVTLIGTKAAENILPKGAQRVKTWSHWQYIRADRARIERWYANGRTGMGLMCGRVSGNVEAFEWDVKAVYDAFKARAETSGLGPVVERVESGYLEATPGGGFHVLYHCLEGGGSTKLAQRPLPPDEDGTPKVKTLIETKGQGGFIVTAPSNGKVHPNGGQYRLLRGGFATIATITTEERDELHELARSFDEMPKKPHQIVYPSESTKWLVRPGDDFAAKTSWNQILTDAGWTAVYNHGDATYWRRPGKKQGVSASTNHEGHDLLYCWSTSTLFESERGYGKFAAYAVLNHVGDFVKAAAKLAKEGYGTPATDEVPPFPLACLPPVFRALVEEGAASIVCAPDYIAVPLIASTGAVVGDALELEIKPDWCEGANIYTGSVGDPGSKKSPAMHLALHGITHVQIQQRQRFKEEMDAHRDDLARWEGTKKSDRGPSPEPPIFPHLITTDTTTEAVAMALSTARGVLLAKDELASWVRSMDQYRAGGKGADRQHYLSMWSRAFIKIDRKLNPIPLIVEKPHLCVAGGVQPDLLSDLADAQGRADGFLDRILWSYPAKVPDDWTPIGLNPSTRGNIEAVFERLYLLEGTRTVHFSADVAPLWATWYRDNVAEKSAETFPRQLIGPWDKMPAQLARIALILYAMTECASEEIDADTFIAAAALVSYFKAHAKAVYTCLADKQRDGKITLLAKLKTTGPLTKTDIVRKVFNCHTKSAIIQEWLEELEEAGLVQCQQRPSNSGPASKVWAHV